MNRKRNRKNMNQKKRPILERLTAFFMLMTLLITGTLSGFFAYPITADAAEPDAETSEFTWRETTAERNLYYDDYSKNLMGVRYQGETIEEIFQMAEDPSIEIDMDSFFDGTCFEGFGLEELEYLQGEGYTLDELKQAISYNGITSVIEYLYGISTMASYADVTVDFTDKWTLDCVGLSKNPTDTSSVTIRKMSTTGGDAMFCLDHTKGMAPGKTLSYAYKSSASSAEGKAIGYYLKDKTFEHYIYAQAYIWCKKNYSDDDDGGQSRFISVVKAVLTATGQGVADFDSPYLSAWGTIDGGAYGTTVYVYTTGDSSDQPLATATRKKLPDKGSIEIEKVSANPTYTNGNSNYDLSGAKFQLIDADGSIAATLTTVDGYASASGILAKNYTLREITASAGYDVVADRTVTIKANETTSLTGSNAIKEPLQLGNFSLTKSSSNTSLTDCNANYSLENAEFTLTAQWNSSLVYTLKTDKYGKAGITNIPIGKYTLKETKAPAGHAITFTPKTITITANETETYPVEDTPRYDPMNVFLYKNDSQTAIEAQGDAKLTGAVFHFAFYDEYNLTDAQIQNGTAKPVFEFDAQTKELTYASQTRAMISLNKNGSCIIASSWNHVGKKALNDFYDSNGQFCFPLGTIAVYEKTAPEGYTIEGNVIQNANASVKKTNNLFTQEIKASSSSTDYDLNVLNTLLVENDGETMESGSVKVAKLDSQGKTIVPQGDARLQSSFAIYNKSANAVVINGTNYEPNALITTIKTDIQTGIAKFSGLKYGTYYIKEVTTDDSYNLVPWERTFFIHEDNLTVDYTGPESAAKNDVKRGGVAVQKFTEDFLEARPEGDATLQGAEFTIVNNSKQAVYGTDGTKYAVGDVVAKITTSESGFASTGVKVLPIGTYTITETKAPAGYLLNSTWSKTFKITYEGQVISFNDIELTDENYTGDNQAVSETPIRGGVKIYKTDKNRSETVPTSDDNVVQGDASLEGAKFAIVNRSAYPVVVNGKEYAVGQTCLTLTTNDKGVAQSVANVLPYGTYDVYELSADDAEGYLLNSDWIATFYIRTNNKIVEANTYTVNPAKETIYRGGITLSKIDTDTDSSVPQGDATLEGAVFSIYNDSKQAVYVNGAWYNPGTVCATVSTDEDGMITTSNNLLPYGSYHIVETTPSKGYLLNTDFRIDFTIRENGKIYDLTNEPCEEDVIRGGVRVYKTDKNRSETTPTSDDNLPQGDATLAGARFAIINRSANPVVVDGWTFKVGKTVAYIETDATGVAVSDADLLPYGTYEIREVTSPDGYFVNSDWNVTIQIREDGKIVDANSRTNNPAKETVYRGGFKLSKIDAETDLAVPQGDATLAGAVFNVYNDSAFSVYVNGKWYAPGAICATVTTGADGTVTTANDLLPYGSYHITEKTPSTGYLLNKNFRVDFEVREDGMIYDLTNTPCEEDVIRGDVQIQKWDLELNKSEAIGGKNHGEAGTDLNDIEFTITNTSEQHVLVNGKLYDPGEVVMTIQTHWNETLKAYTAETKNRTLPYGTYTIQETKTNNYYLLTDGTARTFEIRKDGATVVADKSGNNLVFKDQVVRGDVEFRKIADGTSYRMSTLWTLTNTVTGEVHVIAADENGEFYSNAQDGFAHTLNTNVNDKLLERIENGETISMSEVDLHSGVWFGLGEFGSVAKPNDSLGALPYGSYVLKEIRTDSNEGYDLKEFPFYVYRDGHTVDLGTITNDKMELHTTALEDSTGQHIGMADESVVIVDTVTYKGLTAGKEYKLIGTLMDKTSGGVVYTTDKSGKSVPVTAETIFTPESTDGELEMTFVFDGRNLAGHSVVVFEDLYDADGYKVIAHMDINDEKQTVTFPAIHTTAISDATKSHDAPSTGKIQVTDTVTYENLLVGKSYKLYGTLMDKTTGDEALDANGREITSMVEFVPKEANGTMTVTFTFDSSSLSGHTTVVFESLEYRGERIALHADWEDEGQTIQFPEIETTAKYNKTGTQEGVAEKTAVITDKVDYTNLIPGEKYVVTGWLMDKTTGKELTDANGNRIQSQATFQPVSANGSVDVVFTFDASALAGHDVVAFESLRHNDVEVATHLDIEDEAQTIHFPKISTSAGFDGTKYQEGLAAEDAQIVDTVTYENLQVGEEYVVTGTLMDKATGLPVIGADNQKLVVSKTFTPSEKNGTVDVVFTFDATEFAGHTFVVYETLTHKSIDVATHKDMNDEDQTVRFPKISTSLLNQETGMKEIKGGEEVTVTDTITYENLTVGQKYIMQGKLVDKSTGKTLKDVDSDEVTFVPKSANGSVDVTFTFDTTGLEGKTFVAFESLYRKADKELVAVHEDIADKDQMVFVPKISTSAIVEETGNNEGVADKDSVIVDTVTYENLIAGNTYTVTGTLMDKSTGKSVKDSKGNTIVQSVVFTPVKANGSIDVVFTFDASAYAGKDIVVFETLKRNKVELAVHADIEDENQTIHYPKISTSAVYGDTDVREGLATEETTIVDTVSYENLRAGEEYTMSGILMDKDSKAPVLDAKGKPLTAKTIFTPKEKDGTVDVTFTFNALGFEGHTFVVYETLTRNSNKVDVADHKDITDEGQSVHFPKIGTSLKDSESGFDETYAGGTVTLVDTVTYQNLTVGNTYVISGKLVDKETGKDVKNVEPVEVTFKPEKSDGTIQVSFTFDTTGLEGTSVVAFESLYRKSGDVLVKVAIHEDITDEEQTVSVPKISTSAICEKTGNNEGVAEMGAVIIDTVTYENLHVGRGYTLTGVLMDVQTGEPVEDADGNPITQKVGFAPETEDGAVDVTFRFDASAYAGKDIVVFETLTRDGVVLAKHTDIDDENQTVHYPKISTSAVYGDTDVNEGKPIEETIIKDTVSYENLRIGEEYTVTGVLVNQASGAMIMKPVVDEAGNEVFAEDGTVQMEPITASTVFVPEETDGTVDVVFTFDATGYEGQTFVVYETLIRNSNSVEVADHKDITDEGQSIHFPKIATTLVEKETGLSESVVSEKTTLLDTVNYENLTVGKKYVMTGTLMEKSTGEALTDADGNAITSSVEFTPEETSGVVEIEFTFDSTALKGKTVVAFESLTREGIETAVHADIEDAAQTVKFPNIATVLHKTDSDEKILYVNNSVALTDIIKYENLTIGNTYEVAGTLMLKSTGEAMKDADGNPITSSIAFVAEAENGEVEVAFTFDGTKLGGDFVVAYERLYATNTVDGEDVQTLLVIDEDLENKDQTVEFPKPEVDTTAVGKTTGSHMLEVAEQMIITDGVTYENLNPGTKYTVIGTLMDKSTGEAFVDKDGKTITTEMEFVPVQPNGTLNVEFVVNSAELSGKSLVVFETVLLANVVIASHEDIKDDDQTVHVMSIQTVATGEDKRSKDIPISEKAVIVDTVSYTNLVPGVTYTIHGIVIDKATGKAVQSNGKDVVIDATFTPKEANGAVDMTFTLNTSDMQGKTLVCFESVYDENGKLLGSHEDIDDKDQSVVVKNITKIQTGVQTWAGTLVKVILGLLVVAFGVAGGVFIRRKRMIQKARCN